MSHPRCPSCGGVECPVKLLKINLDDPHTRAVWETVQRAKQEVASWPAWKRGDDDVLTVARLRAALLEACELWGQADTTGTVGARIAELRALATKP